MSLIVQKYGGSSVADAACVKRVAQRIVDTKKQGNEVVVVVSAMGDTTDELIELAEQVSPKPAARELDMLLTAGERISMAVLAMAIHDLGMEARSYTGSQAGLITDATHGKARIIDVAPERIRQALDEGAIPIVAGFQGVSKSTKDITTLGRGGSDTTAVALAAALKADICEIYTDVDGIFTADPRIVKKAHPLKHITYEEVLELSANGAKVLHSRCVEYARRFKVPVHVRSSFSNKEGTWLISDDERKPGMEQPIISGIAQDLGDAKVTIIGVPDKPGTAATIFENIATAGVNIDMIVQNVSVGKSGKTDVTFTCPKADGEKALKCLEGIKSQIGFESLDYDDQIAKISLVGAGMKSHPGVSATLFRAMAKTGANIEMISTSEIRISVVTRSSDAPKAVEAIHTAFQLDSENEAVVYAGTGR